MVYNPFPQIDLPFGKDNKYFLDLFDSIIQVDRRYIEYNVKYNDNRFGYEKHLERVFAYELYRHWGNRIVSGCPSLMLNAEINKVISVNKILCKSDNNENSPLPRIETTLYPDMVLHHSQGDDKAQIMICEIKRDKNLTDSLIFGDLYKECCYMSKEKFKEGKEPFRYGVFIVIGDNRLSHIFEKLKNSTAIKTNDGDEDLKFVVFVNDKTMNFAFSRIVCVAYDGNVLEYNTFNKLINLET